MAQVQGLISEGKYVLEQGTLRNGHTMGTVQGSDHSGKLSLIRAPLLNLLSTIDVFWEHV